MYYASGACSENGRHDNLWKNTTIANRNAASKKGAGKEGSSAASLWRFAGNARQTFVRPAFGHHKTR